MPAKQLRLPFRSRVNQLAAETAWTKAVLVLSYQIEPACD